MKVTTLVQFLLALLAVFANVDTCSCLYGNETDRLSLLDFKKATLDPLQALISWNDSIHFCDWGGVACRAKDPRRVISLHLTDKGLVGKISPSLANLTLLKDLFLDTNKFTGQIPPSLGHLHRLQRLVLSNNTLQGIIPSFANCSNLRVLALNGNNIVGQIPMDLPLNLEALELKVNNLTGTIPDYLANMTALFAIDCVSNNIQGNIPDGFAALPGLQIISMGGNKLVGRFPQAILNISTLDILSLPLNYLTGELPSHLGEHLPNLQELYLGSNLFQGHMPPSLINASKLSLLDISNNNFSGVIPSAIGKLTKLYMLNLGQNKLETHSDEDWEFMHNLANCTELQFFSIASNCLEGHVPASLGNLSSQLHTLYLSQNNLSARFPSGIEYLPNLTRLALEYNQFTGGIPEWLGSLKKLQTVRLDHNNFTGFLPTSLSNLSQLGQLILRSNKFGGLIPPGLGNLQMLQHLDISNNNLHGRVPKEIFRIPTSLIDLSFNNLDGRLPTEIGNAKQLSYLSLSTNKLSGDIPNTLGNCESLESIYLDSNIFNRSIPTSIGNIHSLSVLNLSNNNLTGSIPASLGNLNYLGKLDLSFNHLEGEVPTEGIFKNVTAVRIDGDHRLCGGVLELHLLACPVMPSKSTNHKPSVVLKVVTPVVIIVSIAMGILALLFLRGKQKRKSLLLPSFGTQFPKVSFNDIARATQGFATSNIIGRGRYGSVYQGKLFQDGSDVAIKVFNLETRGSQKSFIAECNTLRNVRHRNLIPILTACSSIDSNGNDFKALVYEFMPGGDLHRLLYSTQDDEGSSDRRFFITLAQRLSIVVDIADALEYLHHNNERTIVHCDMKPSNILLDDNMTAHVGDFGLARFKVDSVVSSPSGSYSTSSVAIKGTIGYVAPECATGANVSTASDVYSFGIILLEIFLCKRPTDDMFKDGLDIVKFVEVNYPCGISQIVDLQLLQDEVEFPQGSRSAMKAKDLNCLISVLNIGLCCTKVSPNERLNMHEVAARLHGIKEAYLRDRGD